MSNAFKIQPERTNFPCVPKELDYISTYIERVDSSATNFQQMDYGGMLTEQFCVQTKTTWPDKGARFGQL